MYEENSMDYQTQVYCYETPPQESGYSIEGDKCQRIVEDNMNYWEPTTSAHVSLHIMMTRKLFNKSLTIITN